MASALELMGHGVMSRSNATPASAVGMMLADTGIGFGASVALGEVYGRYADLPGWKGKLAKYSPEISGGVGKLGEMLATLFLGPGFVSGACGALGQAGVNAVGLEIGLNHARKDRGIAVVKVPEGTNVRQLKPGSPVPASTAVGALAPHGRTLAWDHIAELQQMH